MSSLTGRSFPSTYKDLLKVERDGRGFDESLRNVEDGDGRSSGLQLGLNSVNLKGDVYLQGTLLRLDAGLLNNLDQRLQSLELNVQSKLPADRIVIQSGTGIPQGYTDGTIVFQYEPPA